MNGKIALVTGGSRGIGRAICLELAAQGADVALCCAGNLEAAEETAAACRELGVRAMALQCRVEDMAAVTEMVKAVQDTLGPVDILVNNAGITRDGLLMTMKEDAFDAVVDTCLKGAWNCAKAVSRSMIRRRYGRIVNITSAVALRGNPGQSNYVAAKAGLIGLTKSLAKELAARNITVNAVAPGFITTDMTAAMPEAAREAAMHAIPQERAGTPEDVAKAAAFLAGSSSAYITGQVLAVDGGMSM